ncbi:hypothetical protein BRADI_1g46015v3 [Brachypodium distachyon]|uniref:Uncharacterized protein n=1 Tax=Brachypodium distachyon TaxID=15368 RepID=A0A2K2DPN0_BRADI|nr:hypothetical protein BRADI_1g46015v3 [Brachypodium distachyon]
MALWLRMAMGAGGAAPWPAEAPPLPSYHPLLFPARPNPSIPQLPASALPPRHHPCRHPCFHLHRHPVHAPTQGCGFDCNGILLQQPIESNLRLQETKFRARFRMGRSVLYYLRKFREEHFRSIEVSILKLFPESYGC